MSAPEHPDASATPAAGGEADYWLKPGWFALLLGVLVAVSFPQVLTGFETFAFRDYPLFGYPNAFYQRECFWQGELPFWNPYNYCGVPFLAQWNTMPLYPPALLYLLLPLTWSLSFFCLAHVEFAGLGMYFLCYRWTGNRLAAAIAGTAFACNGFSLSLLIWPSPIATLSWMPWVVLAVQRAWQHGGRAIVWAALAGALQMLAGGPETILFTWLIAFAIWAGEMLREKTWGATLLRFAAVVLLVVALAAPQLLPFGELAGHSQRGLGFGDNKWSLPGRGWVNFLVPMAFGRITKENVFFQHGQGWTSSYYLGTGILLLALLAAGKVRERRAWLLAGISVVGFILALGDQTLPGKWARELLPQLTVLTYPVKYVTWIIFAGPLLAGLCLARWCQAENSFRPALLRLAGVLTGLIGLILFWEWMAPLPLDDRSATLRNGLSRAAGLWAFAGLLLAWPKTRTLEARRMIGLALVFVLWLDLRTHEPQQNPSAPNAVYAPGIVRAELGLTPEPALGRSRVMNSAAAEEQFANLHVADVKDGCLANRLGYFCNLNLLDGVPKVNGFLSLTPLEANGFIGLFYVFKDANLSHLLDFLGVSHVTAPGQLVQWQARPSFHPLVTAGQRPVFLGDTNAVHELMRPTFDTTQLVILPPDAAAFVTVTNQTRARVLAQQFLRDRVELELEVPERSLVVLAQTFYPCWRAYADGQPVQLLRANYAFQAIEVPAGTRRVQLVYEDRAFRIGTILCGAALLFLGAWWWWAGRRHGTTASSEVVVGMESGSPS